MLFSFGGFCLHSFLSLHSLLSWPSVSLASVSLTLFFCSGTLHLPSYLSLLSLWGTDVLPPWSLLLVLLLLWPCVVLVHHLRNSVESQFLHEGVLPLGRVLSYGCSWGRSGLGHLWPLFWSMILFFFCFCSWLGGLSSASVRSFGVPLLLSLSLGLSAFPYGLAFFLFVLCRHLSPFGIFPHSLFTVSVFIYLFMVR